MQKPPTWELTEAVHITAIAPLNAPVIPATSSTLPPSGMFGPHNFGPNHIVIANSNTIDATKKTLEQEYQTRISQLPQTIEQELAATRLEGTTHPLPPAEAIIRELGVRNTLLHRKTADFHQKTALAHQFYGGDPLNRSLLEFYQKASTMEQRVMPGGIAMRTWAASYRAAHEARLLSQSIQMLNQQHANVLNWLAAVQANDQARLAAEQEARRAAEELARINEQAAARVREQARLAALAESQRLAVEQARRQGAEHARVAAEASRPFPVSGSAVAAGPVFTLAAGRLATGATTNLAVRIALQTGVASVTTAGAAVIAGFAVLLFPSTLGNGEIRQLNVPLSDLVPDNLHAWTLTLTEYKPDSLHALSIPLSDLTPYDLDDLYDAAEANGRVRLPVAIGSKTVENTTEFFVAATNDTTVPGNVPVRLATVDPSLNVYRSYNPDALSIGMTWTPIVKPNNASTTLPASQSNIAVYDGTTLTALEGRADTFPEFDLYSFGGFITVFPKDSGIPPIFTMFKDRRDNPGVASGYGEPISGVWLGSASQGDGAVISNRIADKLRGQDFSSFRSFREEFWRVAIDDPELAHQFTANNFHEMKNGRAPFTRKNDRLGGKVKFELHHVNLVSEGGGVYDIDNIRVITPKRHSELHKGEKGNE